jgi:hypothetical protein
MSLRGESRMRAVWRATGDRTGEKIDFADFAIMIFQWVIL